MGGLPQTFIGLVGPQNLTVFYCKEKILHYCPPSGFCIPSLHTAKYYFKKRVRVNHGYIQKKGFIFHKAQQFGGHWGFDTSCAWRSSFSSQLPLVWLVASITASLPLVFPSVCEILGVWDFLIDTHRPLKSLVRAKYVTITRNVTTDQECHKSAEPEM